MDWINYHHLLYFRTVAREGSITRASKVLSLAQPTISGQIRALEESLDQKLFRRQGRNLVLTDFGRTVYRYADQIFSLGQEMSEMLQGDGAKRQLRLVAGISASVPQILASRILAPLRRMPDPVQLVCQTTRSDELLRGLHMHSFDLILSDAPAANKGRARATDHLLATSGMTLFGHTDYGDKDGDFPASLDGAPFLLPLRDSPLRRSIDHWFSDHSVHPVIAGELEDNALMTAFGVKGAGLFFAPSAIEEDLRSAYSLRVIGHVPEIEERYYMSLLESGSSAAIGNQIVEAARLQLKQSPVCANGISGNSSGSSQDFRSERVLVS